MLPTIRLGEHCVSRLIIGGNPFSGNSHVSSELDAQMEDYFTAENIKRTLFRCQELGINTLQVRGDKHMIRLLREFRLQGGDMHWIAQTAPEMGSFDGNVEQINKSQPIAIYHHGSVTDSLVKKGRFDELTRRLAVLRATGKVVGLATHLPAVITYAEENGWDVDFFMCSVYNISQGKERVSSAITGRANVGEHFGVEDPPLMYRAIQETKKPCLAFKILAASRRCATSKSVQEAFNEAFANIKATDGVIVGMFPKEKDQVLENVLCTKRALALA